MSIILDRRTVLAGMAALAATRPGFAQNAEPAVHEVQMLNVDPENRRERMVYIPALIAVNPGDTVRWLSVNPGHNAESIADMIPQGAESWKSRPSQDFEITLTVPGIYGYKCTPHFATGMVGLIVVRGEGMTDNLEAARAVRHRPRPAQKRFEAMFAQAEEEGMLTPQQA